ncbi:hypothetical protein MAR_001162, partial [Mya arenaria]
FRSIKAFECSDGVPGFKPACWSNIAQPPAGLHKMSTFQIVLEADMSSRCDEFRMVFRARAGGLDFISMWPWKSYKSRAPCRLSYICPWRCHSLTSPKQLFLLMTPLVDPGKIDIPFSKAGPVSALQVFPHVKQELAQGVLTIQIKGTPSEDSGEDIHYTRLRLGKCKRQTLELPATQAWEDCCSFFVFNLLNVKHKCKRLLTTVTLEQHDLELSSFPFTITKQLSHEIKNKDGSKLNLVMDYSPLPPINLDEEEAVNVLQRSGVLFVCVHCANNVIASDKTGSSDPYCVVFCDRRRCNLSFYVFDWDGTNKLDNDFLGSAHHRYRLTSTDSANNNEFLYVEDMVSPGTMQVFDKDLITRNDFLGKVMLTLDDLKELSLKPGKSTSSVSKQEQDANNSAKSQTDGTNPSTGRGMSIESDVFITPSENQKLKSTPDITRESDSQLRKRNSSSMINNKGDKASPVTSTPLKKDQNMEVGLKRSASDVNMDKRRRSTSNSPNRRRLRLIFGNRVIAKSPLIKATQTIVNLPIDIDRGMGIHGDTLLKFDIKREGKEHLASRAYTIKTLFSGEGGEGDKVQKVLPLENNLQIEVYLQHTPVDSSSIRRHGSSRMSVGSRSFRK